MQNYTKKHLQQSDRDQGNAKITRVKKTELKMRPKPERQKCPLAKYSSGGKYVRRQNWKEKVYFMGIIY